MTEDVKHPFLSGMLFERERVKRIIASLKYELYGDQEDWTVESTLDDYEKGFESALRCVLFQLDSTTYDEKKAGNDA